MNIIMDIDYDNEFDERPSDVCHRFCELMPNIKNIKHVKVYHRDETNSTIMNIDSEDVKGIDELIRLLMLARNYIADNVREHNKQLNSIITAVIEILLEVDNG